MNLYVSFQYFLFKVSVMPSNSLFKDILLNSPVKKSTVTYGSVSFFASRLFCIDSRTNKSKIGILLFCINFSNELPDWVILPGSAISIFICSLQVTFVVKRIILHMYRYSRCIICSALSTRNIHTNTYNILNRI